ncbi:hypothetical protein ASD32_24195 [Rhizobium sp. Root483D2]|jgi:hypothetical protein|nr:hypothetical protein ASD32_24195 [Rhizobium sp. Root483D2]
MICESDTPLSVILAPVAGIQRPDVRRVKRPFQLKDLSWLDARHTGGHDGRNEGFKRSKKANMLAFSED